MDRKKNINVNTLTESFDEVSSFILRIINTPPERINVKELENKIATLENFKRYVNFLMDNYEYNNKNAINKSIEKYLPDLKNLLLELQVYYGGKNIEILTKINNLAEKIYNEYLSEIKYEFIPYINSRMFSKKLITGVQIIDAQHKALFTFMDKFVSKIINGASDEDLEKAHRFLVKYTHIHFDEEEKLMEESSYPRKRVHKSEHKDFSQMIEKIAQAKDVDSDEAVDNLLKSIYFDLNQWFINHILKSDRDFVSFYKKYMNYEDQV